jgi:hypothetical protein
MMFLLVVVLFQAAYVVRGLEMGADGRVIPINREPKTRKRILHMMVYIAQLELTWLRRIEMDVFATMSGAAWVTILMMNGLLFLGSFRSKFTEVMIRQCLHFQQLV